MPANTAPSWRRHVVPTLALLAGLGVAAPVWAQDEPVDLPILTPPPSVWDHQMLNGRPLLSQTVSNLTAITTGIAFGMGPGEVNTHMPVPAQGISWSALPPATEFQDDIRYFWIRFDEAGGLRLGAKGCVGTDSYIVFLFQSRGLFRISYRLVPDVACPRPAAAALEIFGRFVSLATEVAIAEHYRAGAMEIIDVTDPTALSSLRAIRWQPKAVDQ